MGLLFLAVGFLFMIGAVLQQGGDPDRPTTSHVLAGWRLPVSHTLGELLPLPIGFSMVTKLALLPSGLPDDGCLVPASAALANYAAGFIGSFVGEAGPIAIFGGIALVAVLLSALILADRRPTAWFTGCTVPKARPKSRKRQEKKLHSAAV